MPLSDVDADLGPPSNAGLEISTVAPGITARSSPATVPVELPFVDGLRASQLSRRARRQTNEQHDDARRACEWTAS